MNNDWFYTFLLVVTNVTIYVISAPAKDGTNPDGTNAANATVTGPTNDTKPEDITDDEEKEEHKDLRCYSCNFNVTTGCGDPFDRNDKNVRTAICPNHTMCYFGVEYNAWRELIVSTRGCIYDADGPKAHKYLHFYCNFDLCNGTIRALEFVPFVPMAIFFLKFPSFVF